MNYKGLLALAGIAAGVAVPCDTCDNDIVYTTLPTQTLTVTAGGASAPFEGTTYVTYGPTCDTCDSYISGYVPYTLVDEIAFTHRPHVLTTGVVYIVTTAPIQQGYPVYPPVIYRTIYPPHGDVYYHGQPATGYDYDWYNVPPYTEGQQTYGPTKIPYIKPHSVHPATCFDGSCQPTGGGSNNGGIPGLSISISQGISVQVSIGNGLPPTTTGTLPTTTTGGSGTILPTTVTTVTTTTSSGVTTTTGTTSQSASLLPSTTTTGPATSTTSTASSSPSSFYRWDLDSTFINDMLTYHNAYRANTQANPLTWDAGLAADAQSAADACVFQHTPGNFGQNVATGTYSNAPYYVYLWYSEYPNYPNGPGDYGHFTQVVWKSTTAVGCGYANHCSGGFPFLLFCNYTPAGNVAGQYDANVGTPGNNIPVPPQENAYYTSH